MIHHIMAKAATDEILAKFKNGKWTCSNNLGKNFYRVGCDASFPSPDAAFVDETTKALACFEFKPPTETKRGILTGIGQCVAYLQNCDLSFLIAPKTLEDFKLGDYLEDLFSQQITNKIPVGLIIYDNNNPSNVALARNVDRTDVIKNKKPLLSTSRFWAKHQDLPIELFHLLLHCYYQKRVHAIETDAFAYCWSHFLVYPDVADTMKIKEVVDCENKPIYTLGGKKKISFLDKKLDAYKNLSESERRERIAQDIDINFAGDNYYHSIRKNYETFLKHVGMIDSDCNLTDEGYVMYHLGLVNGPSSKLFKDYFAKMILINGHHLDLILDIDFLHSKNQALPYSNIFKLLNADYQKRGLIKTNPGRQVGEVSKVAFLKYELILWKALGIVRKDGSVDWKRVTEVFMLPERE